MPLALSFVLIVFFIWIPENIATLFGALKYPYQNDTWSLGKVSSWLLLLIVSFFIVAKSILFVGEATNTSEKANQLFKKYNHILEKYQSLCKQVQKPITLYWEWWPKTIFTPGATNWLTEISKIARGRNVFEDMSKSSVQTDCEEIVQRNPDVNCVI